MILGPSPLIDHRSRILASVRFRFRALGQPCSLGDPFTIELSRLRDREDPLRNARSESFINDSEIERHGYRSRFVGFGIEKLAIHHDGNRNQPRLAFIVDLYECQRARALIDVLAIEVLGQLLPVSRGRCESKTEKSDRRRNRGPDRRKGDREEGGADDGVKPSAI